jgi:DNA-directed RNA polymerase subunit RPC12/RpoP
VLTVVLLAVIAVSVICIIKSCAKAGGPPDRLQNEMIERIDRQTGETVTLPSWKWEKLGQKYGDYKNTKTGAYTMAECIVCMSCGAKVPGPAAPRTRDAVQVSLRGYVCPKCGKPVLGLR